MIIYHHGPERTLGDLCVLVTQGQKLLLSLIISIFNNCV